MEYSAAQNFIQKNTSLLGTQNEKGFIVSELIIVPSDSSQRDTFMRIYLSTRKSEVAIRPFINNDVEVWAIDTNHLFNAGILFYNVLQK